jgi:lipoate---protein ligase
MHLLDHSFPSPQANLAWDEALIEWADASVAEHAMTAEDAKSLEVLRLWEMPQPCVVLGRSSRIDQEVHVDRCREDGVPVLRRMSGGATIVAGPGCLMYSVLLSLDARPECRSLDVAHRFVMERTRDGVVGALRSQGSDAQVEIRGICDLTLVDSSFGDRKISGNSLRVKRHWLMYHGTLLLDMPLEWISRYLSTPPKQPEYRERRSHDAFVASLENRVPNVSQLRESLKPSLARVWGATNDWSKHAWHDLMPDEMERWLQKRYLDPNWHTSR